MKILVAIDSFKGSLSSLQAGYAAARGIKKAHPDAEIIVTSLADGGEGTTQTLIEGLNGEKIELIVKGPLDKKVNAYYGIINNDTAVIEIAQACGLTLVNSSELNPWKANTFGVGELILNALNRGIRKFIIGLGGSATTEGGIGMLDCLGVEFFDKENQKLEPELKNLNKIHRITTDKMPKALKDSSFEIACDVINPLNGSNGAVAIYGKQKGVMPEEVFTIDESLKSFAQVTGNLIGKDNSFIKGSGAAGGLGFAFLSYLPNSRLRSGFEIINEATQLNEQLRKCDIVLTGEGRLDSQTVQGKVPVALAKIAKENGVKTVIAIAGSVTDEAKKVNREGIDAFFSILRSPISLSDAMDPKRAQKNIELTVEQIFNLLN